MATAGEHFLKGSMEYTLHLYLQEHSYRIVPGGSSREPIALQACISRINH